MKKILITDDAPTVLKLLEFTLTDEGYTVDKASNAEEAMRQVEQNGPYDLGIFDVNMPGKTGIELTKDVLESPNGRNMQILILTTESSDEMKAKGKEAGAKGWLVKPFNDEALLAVVEKCIGKP
jgi:two-component system chemotaxis response regulator CheY